MRYLSIGQLYERFGGGRCTLRSFRVSTWRAVKEGTFPVPLKLSSGRIAWPEAEVEAWLSARRPRR